MPRQRSATPSAGSPRSAPGPNPLARHARQGTPRARRRRSEAAEFAWADGLGEAHPGGRDRRAAERVLTYWRQKLDALGEKATVAALDLGHVHTEEWANRFLISVDPVIERSALLLYGPEFARLVGLPALPRT